MTGTVLCAGPWGNVKCRGYVRRCLARPRSELALCMLVARTAGCAGRAVVCVESGPKHLQARSTVGRRLLSSRLLWFPTHHCHLPQTTPALKASRLTPFLQQKFHKFTKSDWIGGFLEIQVSLDASVQRWANLTVFRNRWNCIWEWPLDSSTRLGVLPAKMNSARREDFNHSFWSWAW